jgi:hypothetical protein
VRHSGAAIAIAGTSIVLLLSLAGCNSVVIMHDPKTGATAQCHPDSGNLFAQHAAETCAEGYEKLGWQRVN